jgi:hypothetical protein
MRLTNRRRVESVQSDNIWQLSGCGSAWALGAFIGMTANPLYLDESKDYNALCREGDLTYSAWQSACIIVSVPRQRVREKFWSPGS